MDRKIERSDKAQKIKRLGAIISLASFITYSIYAMSTSSGIDTGRSQTIALKSVQVSEIISGSFEDSLTVRGVITPKTTVYLDTVSGGRVEEVYVEQGEYVKEGQPLIRLSNVELQLDVISREAQISEQLNFLRNTQLAAETNRLDLKRELLENDNQIVILNRQIKSSLALFKNNLISKNELADLEQNLSYYTSRRNLNLQRQKQEEKIRELQIKQLEDSAVMLQENLKFARQNLQNLVIKAPVGGHLSDLIAELGESKQSGTRLGQIDIPGAFKVVASVDEFYLNLIVLNMTTKLELNDRTLNAKIDKIDRRVNDGRFTIEIYIPIDDTTSQLTRGQSINFSIVMGTEKSESLMVKRGAFVSETGGNWAFVVNPNNTEAEKRMIRLGKKNKDYYTIEMGLIEGEKIVTSSYAAFKNATKLRLQ